MQIKKQLGLEHETIEGLLTELGNLAEVSDLEAIQKHVRALNVRLRAHLDGEERFLLCAFEGEHPEAVLTLRRQHEELVVLLEEIGVEADLHALRKHTVNKFIRKQQAHADLEARTLYNWTEDELPEKEKIRVMTWLREKAESISLEFAYRARP